MTQPIDDLLAEQRALDNQTARFQLAFLNGTYLDEWHRYYSEYSSGIKQLLGGTGSPIEANLSERPSGDADGASANEQSS